MSNKVKTPSSRTFKERTIDGRYKVVREIGQGAAGKVYEGVQIAVERRVAIKILNRSNYERDDYRERFTREAKAIARMSHTNCITLHDFGYSEEFDSLYMVMEFVDGVELYELIKDEPLPFRRALKVSIQIAEALAHAHKFGILHRDLKPENVLVGKDDEVKVLDFGLARIVDLFADESGRRLTAEGAIFGTPAYMSPEQCGGDPDVTVHSDIYSLGVVLYQLFEGRLPFDSKEVVKVLVQHAKEEPPPMQAAIPSKLKSLVGQMLKKEKSARPSTATQVADTLRAVFLGIAMDDVRMAPDVSQEIHRSLVSRELEQSRDIVISHQFPDRRNTEDGLGSRSPRNSTPDPQPAPAAKQHPRMQTAQLVGNRIGGEYQLVSMLADGAMSSVFRAADSAGQPVAVKVVARHVPEELRASDRFQREVALLERLDHPNIVRLLDHGHDEAFDRLYLVTELVEGDTLARLCDETRTPVELAMLVASQVLGALGHAHAAGAVHRDIKPSNIILEPQPDGAVKTKLLDFGLARLVDDQTRLTTDGVPGTLAYLSPEQLKGSDASSASDVYALGVVLYQMLSGHCPFQGRSPQQVAVAVQKGNIPPLANFVHEVPQQLSELIEKMMRAQPSQRPSVQEAQHQLENARRVVNFAPVRVAHRGPAGDPKAAWRLRRRVSMPTSAAARPVSRSTSNYARVDDVSPDTEWQPRSRAWIWMFVILVLLAAALGIYLTVINPPS